MSLVLETAQIDNEKKDPNKKISTNAYTTHAKKGSEKGGENRQKIGKRERRVIHPGLYESTRDLGWPRNGGIKNSLKPSLGMPGGPGQGKGIGLTICGQLKQFRKFSSEMASAWGAHVRQSD